MQRWRIVYGYMQRRYIQVRWPHAIKAGEEETLQQSLYIQKKRTHSDRGRAQQTPNTPLSRIFTLPLLIKHLPSTPLFSFKQCPLFPTFTLTTCVTRSYNDSISQSLASQTSRQRVPQIFNFFNFFKIVFFLFFFNFVRIFSVIQSTTTNHPNSLLLSTPNG